MPIDLELMADIAQLVRVTYRDPRQEALRQSLATCITGLCEMAKAQGYAAGLDAVRQELAKRRPQRTLLGGGA